MTDKEIKELYKQSYCSKEAGLLSAAADGIRKIIPHSGLIGKAIKGGAKQTTDALVHAPSNSITKLWNFGWRDVKPGSKVWQFIKNHPWPFATAAGAAGAFGTYAGAKSYIDYKQRSHPLYGIGEFIKNNPGLTAAIAGGLITSPLWLPPVINSITGRNNTEGNGMNMGAATNRFRMGYYPG